MPEQINTEPMLDKGRSAEWAEVNQKLINRVRSLARGRARLREKFDGMAVPCENLCDEKRGIGEKILIVHFHGEAFRGSSSRNKQDRFFCSVSCQRQNYLENPERFRCGRKKKS